MASPADASNQRSLKRSRNDFTDHITVLVGKEERAFLIHKNIACDKSDFFKAACNGDWKERKEKTIRLPNAEVRAFTIFVGWLYTNELDLCGTGQKPMWSTNMDAELRRNIWADVYGCYVLGDFLGSMQFCNTLVDELMASSQATERVPNFESLERIAQCGALRLSSALGRLLIDYVAVDMKVGCFKANMERYPAAFLAEVAKVCVVERRMKLIKRTTRNRSKCYYHEHKDERDKCGYLSAWVGEVEQTD